MELSFLVSRYDRELDRKDKLTAVVGLPVTILAALGGVIAAVSRGFSYPPGWFSAAFMFGVSLHLVATGRCLYWLTMNYAGSLYEYLPRLADLEDFRRQLQGFAGTEHLFDEDFRGAIIKATDANAATNDRRTAYIDRANRALVYVLITTAFCGGVYVIDQVFKGR